MLLRYAHDASVLDAEGVAGTRTLQEAGLCPRAKLLATLQSDPGRVEALQAAKAAVSEDTKQTAAKADAARKAKMAEAEMRKLERDRTISSFKEDREDLRQRASLACGASASAIMGEEIGTKVVATHTARAPSGFTTSAKSEGR